MALQPLATVADLTARGVTVTAGETTKVTTWFNEASEVIRDAAGVPISRETSTVVLEGSCDRWLRLPGQPVVSVASVEIDGTAVTDFRLRSGQLWRATGWQSTWEPSDVEVTMTHGLLEVPEDVVGLVCVLVLRALMASRTGETAIAPPPSDVVAVGIDDYRVQFRQDSDGRQVTLFEIPERVRCALRARFGAGATVVTVR